MLIDEALSPEQEEELEQLLIRYRQLAEEINHYRKLREDVARQIVQYICPFKPGDRVYLQKPIRRFHEPAGICEVVEILPIGHNSDEGSYAKQPGFIFTVKRVLQNGVLSKYPFTTYMPNRWRKAK